MACKRLVAVKLRCPSCGREVDYVCDARYWDGSLHDESKSYVSRQCLCKERLECTLEMALKHIFVKEGCLL